ncbi:mannitol 2-dehydrogenase [Hasllibacter halocynthiae]|uniref:Mannitol 2-dehydrogenase n=1 Tax=Hasllibacter halocynthiae TaxID=595589 RepID=A0A2T0WZA9_9RHOB|nr:mannitol dehydrogenase family protein [Hasllibacter halocynthiae]PRY92021.1 mannitol 2-dehydrogenase [Hasllibacter halocynthiae]
MDELSPVPLSDRDLDRLPTGVLRPRYDRATLAPGIVHIGTGNFHRAHQGWYLHRLMQEGMARDWAVLGAGVRTADALMRRRLLAQDGLTTLIQLDPEYRAVEVTGAMAGFVPVEEGHGPLIAAMADPRIRIVSLTVTEGGYFRTGAGALDEGDADLAHDAGGAGAPRTAFGAMVAALAARRAAGHRPFTGLSCDNLQGNGEALRAVVLRLAAARDPTLARWIEAEGAFPNAMVDCIVPATGEAERGMARALGIADAVPVTHEPFRQWVIEDRFADGRPPLEEVGVTFVESVHDHEAMKLRLLNAGHQLLANAGELLGHATIADCMADADLAGFLRHVLAGEAAPHVAPVPDRTPAAYVDLVARRFANPMIRDTVRRVAFDGTARHATFVLPTVRDALAAGAPLDGLALAEALWARMCEGEREDGTAIEPNDPRWQARRAAARAARADPAAWLRQREVYGDLLRAERFASRFAAWHRAICGRGVRAALRACIGGPGGAGGATGIAGGP